MGGGLNQYNPRPYKRENLEADRCTGRIPRNDKGRDQGDASVNQGTARTVRKPPEARGTFSLIGFRRNQPCQCLDLELLVSRTLRQYTPLAGVTQFAELCCGQASELARHRDKIGGWG